MVIRACCWLLCNHLGNWGTASRATPAILPCRPGSLPIPPAATHSAVLVMQALLIYKSGIPWHPLTGPLQWSVVLHRFQAQLLGWSHFIPTLPLTHQQNSSKLPLIWGVAHCSGYRLLATARTNTPTVILLPLPVTAWSLGGGGREGRGRPGPGPPSVYMSSRASFHRGVCPCSTDVLPCFILGVCCCTRG